MPDNSAPIAKAGVATVDKAGILAALREKGQDGRADFVDRQLPEIIDVASNAGLLRTLGLDVADLTP
ncbi:hypothetical protein [Catellatospora chokoriensis]|uniref:Uncharacterized protein n=1 Tax=Catellatospora chokoriensis TaxID=310353 RepID=A0A8J3NPB6_9ACTN|nr:hypothetical protein [Catellatospora chokoriensis]GIF87775.1 hypothetical protein Cch02nite_12190 [Catellatospora chokoriensis]